MKMNRRDFLKTGAMTAAAFGLANPFANALTCISGSPSQFPVLIVVNLEGGNDGLNTLIPIAPAAQYNRYMDLRGLVDPGTGQKLGYDTSDPNVHLVSLAGNSNLALAPGMDAFGTLW